MFLSIFIATCRPHNIVPFFNNLAETVADPQSFEVLIKLDEGSDQLIAMIEDYKKTATFSIKYLVRPKLNGYYSLDVGYNELLKIAHPDSYFCWLLTDEIRLKTYQWDNILKKYIGFFADDVFRIKLSVFQLKNYIDFFECLPCPDNYAVTTRKWLNITGGWGHFWGPDSWHQCIEYFLGLCTTESHPYGIWRSFPIFDIDVQGQEAGQGIVDQKAMRERVIKIWHGWRKHSGHRAQENFFKLAQRLNAHIYAQEHDLEQYILKENYQKKEIAIYHKSGKCVQKSLSFKVKRFKLKPMMGYKKLQFWQTFPVLFNFAHYLFYSYRHKLGIIGFCYYLYQPIGQCVSLLLTPVKIVYRLLKYPRRLIKRIILFPVYLYQAKNTKKQQRRIMTYLFNGKYLQQIN